MQAMHHSLYLKSQYLGILNWKIMDLRLALATY